MASGSNSAPTDSGSAAAAIAAATTSSAGGAATAAAAGGTGHAGFDMAATDVDEPGCGPLPLPEPYRTPVADYVVHCGPHELWRQLFTDSKPFHKAVVLEVGPGGWGCAVCPCALAASLPWLCRLCGNSGPCVGEWGALSCVIVVRHSERCGLACCAAVVCRQRQRCQEWDE